MATTQAKRIRDILIDALKKYNASINLSTSGRAYSEIVTPVYEALRPDVFEEEVETYLMAAIKEQYPSLELQDGDLIVDLLIRPLQLLLEPLKREINLLRKRQSVRYSQSMTIEDAEDLAANFFINRKVGRVASGTVRVYLTNPTYLTINRGVRFSTVDGLGFVAVRQEFVSAGTVATQKENNLYYADIQVISEDVGLQYNVPANTVVRVEGIPGFVQCTNIDPMFSGDDEETKEELLTRVEASLTERSLTTRLGITSRLFNDFTSIDHVQVIGYGDPEMDRDILVGTGDGELLASGVSILFGRYVFMLTGYENADNGNKLPKPGDKVKLNFWKFIYGSVSVEDNEIQDIVYSSYGDAPDSPTVHIFLLKSSPAASINPPTGALPGVLPGVFLSIFGNSTITISGVPEGIYQEDQDIPYQLESNQVHIGGKYDVWVMPSATETATSSFTVHRTPDVLKSLTVSLDGTPEPIISGLYSKNRVSVSEYVIQTNSPLTPRSTVIGDVNKSYAFIKKERSDLGANYYTLVCRSGFFSVGEILTSTPYGVQAEILSISFTEADVHDVGAVITMDINGDSVSYSILQVEENYYVVNAEIEDAYDSIDAYIHRHTGLNDMFNPKVSIFPLLSDYAVGLQTYIGREDVYISHDLLAAGVTSGDILEILTGEDRGLFTITEISQFSSSSVKVLITPIPSKTNSNLRFRIVRTTEAMSSPFVSMLPGGVVTQVDDVIHTIPYAKSIGAYAVGAFAGANASSHGLNGFALPNLGPSFKGAGAYAADIILQPDSTVLSQFTNTKFDDCISEGCTPCDGIPVVIVVTIDGQAASFSNTRTYIEGLTNAQATAYLVQLRTWLKDLVNSFFRGTNSTTTTTADDLDAFIDTFAPFYLGQPTNPNEHVISRIEMCIPHEVFDGKNNVYMAIPEIEWDSAFESVSTFEQAIIDFLAGDLYREQPALSVAKPGDALKIDVGANAGEYVIEKVVNIPLYTDSCILTEVITSGRTQQVQYSINEARIFNYTLVIIRGYLPEEVLKGSSQYFMHQIPNVPSILPIPPAFPANIEVRALSGNNAGSLLNPFSVIEDLYTTVFKALYAQGLDLPDEFVFAPGPTLEKVVKLMFSSYTTGIRSCPQTVRMMFQDPIDVTVYSPKAEKKLTWKPEVLDAPVSFADKYIALPVPILAGKTISAQITRNLDQESTILTGTLPSSIDSISNIDEFVAALQTALDPNYSYVMIGYETHTTASSHYLLKVTALFGGQGSYLHLSAESPDDAFYFLGFTSVGVTKNVTRLALSQNLLTTGGELRLLHVPSTLTASAYNYMGVSMDRVWIISNDYTATTNPFSSFTPNTAFTATVYLWPTGNITISGTVVAAMNQSSYGALLVQVQSTDDSTLVNNYSHRIQGINITDYQGVTTVISLNSSTLLEEHVISLAEESFNLCFEFVSPTAYPYVYGTTTPFEDVILASLVWDATGLNVTKNAASFSIDSSIEMQITMQHQGDGLPFIVSTTTATGTPTFTLQSPYVLYDAFLPMFGSNQTTVPEGETVQQAVVESEAIPFNVTVGTQSAVSFMDGVSVSKIQEFENIIAAASTLEEISRGVCALLNPLRPNSPSFVFMPTVAGDIEILSTTNDTISVSAGTRPQNSNGQTYGRTLLDYLLSQSPTIDAPSTLSNSYGVAEQVTGFNGSSQGVSTPNPAEIDKFILPSNGTRFSVTQGKEERQLVVDIQNNEEYFYGVYPVYHANLEIPISAMPRTSVFTANYTNAECCTMFLGGDVSALDLGVQTGDLLYLYEQKFILDNTNMTSLPFSPKKDRVLHVVYNNAKRDITVLSTAGTFLYPETLNPTNNQTPGVDSVKVGDIVYFEHVNSYATVTTVSNKVLTLSNAVVGINSDPVLKYGNSGMLTDNTFRDTSAVFTSADVGKYLVIYGAEQVDVDGSYAITSVDLAGVATIDTNTLINEANLHWAVVKPGTTTPGSSTINGRSATLGVTPVRIYSGTPNKFTIGRISSALAVANSRVEILYGNSVNGPRRGVKQPFKILRPTECRITAQEMAEQGTEGSLYYFDVPATTLSPTFDLNVPENTQCMPIYRTYRSEGYHFLVNNKSFVFSNREQTKLLISSAVISAEARGLFSKAVQIENAQVSATYYTSSVVSQIQYLLEGDSTKSVAADPLARHFLPSYVYLRMPALVGDTEAATEAIIDYINDLQPNEELRLSKIEKQLQFFELDTYSHPVFMYCVTTDLDRNVILTRSNNFVNDDTIKHNGTNRITNFIATESTVSLEGE